MITPSDRVVDPTIYAGARSPEALLVTIRRGDLPLDMKTVTAVVLRVRTATGSTTDWATTVVASKTTSDTLVVKHVFDAAGQETARAGRYRVFPILTIPDGVRRANPFHLAIVD